MQVPAYIPCHPKDLDTLPYCVASLQRHPQISEIVVIAAREVERHARALGARFVDEVDLFEPWFEGEDRLQRWYYQMALKLAIAEAPDAPERFMTIDSDTVFLHDFRLIDDASGTVLHPRMSEHRAPYYVGVEELLGRKVAYDGSYIAHFMIWRSSLVREMLEEFARVKGRPASEGRQVLGEYLATCDRDTRSFSEIDTYGHYIRAAAPEEMTWAARRQLNVLYVAPGEKVLARLRPYYDYCNFHAYRRPTNPALSFAGASWLALRLARDRVKPSARPTEDVA
jgi:hypothetical protein